jgi:DHA1 family multidrug resistance protein-like MFS transporter
LEESKRKHLIVLYASMFIVMTGYGITITILPFHIERMALDSGVKAETIFIHVGALTGVFTLTQFIFSPLWGILSDRIGRRPVFLVGLCGNAVFSVIFGLGSGPTLLYMARMLGGFFSAAILPVAAAYATDESSDSGRGKSIARLGASSGLGVVAGPALGAWMADRFSIFRFSGLSLDGYSFSFLIAAFFALVSLIAAVYWLPEPVRPALRIARRDHDVLSGFKQAWAPELNRLLKSKRFAKLLGYSFLSYFGLALFEGTFALHGQYTMKFGPS